MLAITPSIQHTDLISLAQQIAPHMQAKHLRLSLAESCTGGMAASVITELAGSSTWFDAGVVAYSNAAKQALLQVSADVLQQYGAVSEPVAQAMVQGLMQQGRCELAASVTGIAGPGGGTAEKPVGTVCFAWLDQHGHLTSARHQLSGDRQQVRMQSVALLLQGILHHLATY